jgi:uncharacterized damage-inducible protein DinB
MTSQPDPPLFSDELVSTAGERETLEAFLNGYRAVLRRQLTGLSEDDARRRLVPSETTMAGILKHMASVERVWFQHVLAQRAADEIAGDVGGGPTSWQVGPDETIKDLVAEYERACAESDVVAAGMALDDTAPHSRMGRVSLRWVYVHMIEETARHAGHADIIREQTDGATDFGIQ